MVDVAREMDRRRIELPLMIGGATDLSPAHRGEDRAPSMGTRQFMCSMRAAWSTVVSALLDPKRRTALDTENRELQEKLRIQHAEKIRKAAPHTRPSAGQPCHGLADRAADAAVRRHARGRADASRSSFRSSTGSFFFHAWDLKGKFPAILENPAARELYDDAQALLRTIRQGRGAATAGCVRLLAGVRRGRRHRHPADTRFSFLRQQADHGDGRPNRCLADYGRLVGRPRRSVRCRDPRRGTS